MSLAAGADSAVAFRPPAVPLAVNDPYFSLWSPADRLTDAETMHWSRDPQPLSVLGEVGGRTWRLCGKEPVGVPAARQVSLKVGCTETVYSFDAGGTPVEVRFSTPLLPGRWDVFSRPVTYLTVKGAKAKVAISPAFATDDDSAEMVTNRQTIAGHPALSIGRKDQKPHEAGDRVRADAGWMWLVDAGDHFLLAYDSVTDISFLGREAPAWWRRGRPFGTRFDQMLVQTVEDYPQLMREMADFDAQMRERFVAAGGEKYAAMAELAWRQGFGACRLATAENGDMLLFSKENTSNGCIGTVDILYPQLPHLMLAGVELLKAAIRPDMLYAVSGDWPYPYAPHDLGKFPKADRQNYGMGPGKTDADRMPVEESGNLIIALYAVARMERRPDFADIWWPTVRQWAEYLRKFGFDPENQLCTDDFAGHLAHNANLSIKSIVAFKAFSRLADMRGDAGLAREFHALAVSSAAQWTERAQGGKDGATCLAFGEKGTWSLKYNLALAKALGIDLFPPEVARREVAAYLRNADLFGTPLDCREHWCKVDWLFWVATLTESRRDFEALTDPVYDFLNATEDRVAFPDLYYTKTAKCTRYGKGADQFIGFNARPVIGGIYLPVLGTVPIAEVPRVNWSKDDGNTLTENARMKGQGK